MPWLQDQVDRNLNRYKLACLMLDCKYLAVLAVSIRPGTSYRRQIHFPIIIHLYLFLYLMKLVETW